MHVWRHTSFCLHLGTSFCLHTSLYPLCLSSHASYHLSYRGLWSPSLDSSTLISFTRYRILRSDPVPSSLYRLYIYDTLALKDSSLFSMTYDSWISCCFLAIFLCFLCVPLCVSVCFCVWFSLFCFLFNAPCTTILCAIIGIVFFISRLRETNLRFFSCSFPFQTAYLILLFGILVPCVSETNLLVQKGFSRALFEMDLKRETTFLSLSTLSSLS